jgi:DNA repair protein RecN (Recombination protein N)
MLLELHISNLAVIADARIEFAGGLNCFTGATGAGKSLVIGAVELLLGLRTPHDMLRAGCDEGRVTGRFEVQSAAILKSIDALTDLPISADAGEILLVRKLHATGRSSASLNGHPITLQMLKQIGELLVDVHGQHDHQFLLKPSNQLAVIDQFAGLDELRSRYHATYLELAETRRRLTDLGAGERLRQQQLDLLQFQAREIDAAQLNAAEFVELESRCSVLQNIEKLRKESTHVHDVLYDCDESVLDRLKTLYAGLMDLAAIDPTVRPIADGMKSGVIQLEEAAFDLGRYTQKLDLDPQELGEINERLNLINRIIRKYGVNIEDVLEFRGRVQAEIDQLSRAGTDATELQARIVPLEKQLKSLGDELRVKRQAASKSIAPKIERQLSELGMERARFHIQWTPSSEPTPGGFDLIEFMVQTNPGLPSNPLRKVASGGEIGRIMLALKGVLAAGDRISVLVFDEIDANIGGRLGSVIGAKLRALAAHHQVLCITHLPQIAAFADRHLTVRKCQSGKQTETTVRVMDGKDRVEELAEMIGGERITATTRAQACELLEQAAGPVAIRPAKRRQLATAG